MWFWKLRVLNNDIIIAGSWFWMHRHDNMEIITLPLSGSLTHRDSLGNNGTIYPSEVQSMSAGTGIEHSEMNTGEEDGEFFQIWIETKDYDIVPQYMQKKFSFEERIWRWQLLAGPQKNSWNVLIHQDAFLSRTFLKSWESIEYTKYISSNEIYIMNISWAFSIEEKKLVYRDALWLIGYETIKIESIEESDILLIEVPFL